MPFLIGEKYYIGFLGLWFLRNLDFFFSLLILRLFNCAASLIYYFFIQLLYSSVTIHNRFSVMRFFFLNLVQACTSGITIGILQITNH